MLCNAVAPLMSFGGQLFPGIQNVELIRTLYPDHIRGLNLL